MPEPIRRVRGVAPDPPQGAFRRGLGGLGKFAKAYGHYLTDPIMAVANIKLPGVEAAQNRIDAPTLDADQPDESLWTAPARALGYAPTKAESRGFRAGLLDNANVGNLVPALGALGKATGLMRAYSTVAKLNQGLDYAGMAAGSLEAGEGLAEGDLKRAAMGATMAGLSGASRAIDARPTPQRFDDPARVNDFWTEFAQEAPTEPRPPKYQARYDDIMADLSAETPVGPNAVNARNAPMLRPENPPTLGTKPLTPATPIPPRTQPTLAPVDDAPVSVAAPAGSAAQRKAALRDLTPRRQDAGVLPGARPTPLDPATQKLVDEADALARAFDDPEDVLAQALTPEPAPVTPAVVDRPAGPSDDDLANLLRAERQSMVDRGELDPDAELARMFEGEENLGERRRFNEARQDAANSVDDGSMDEAERIARLIAARGGIRSTDAKVLNKTRTSYKPKASASGELQRVKDLSEGFGELFGTKGVFKSGAGVDKDVMATDLLREFPELKRHFTTGDELAAYLENLNVQRNYRKPVAPKPIDPNAPLPVSEDVIASQEAQAILDAKSGNIRGDDSFDFADLETPLTPEVNAPDPARRNMLRAAAADSGDPNRLKPEPDLMEMLAGRKPAPVVDKFSNGEAQPRLPEAGAVRDVENVTPKVAPTPEQAFSLEPPRVKAPDQPTLPQALPDDVPTGGKPKLTDPAWDEAGSLMESIDNKISRNERRGRLSAEETSRFDDAMGAIDRAATNGEITPAEAVRRLRELSNEIDGSRQPKSAQITDAPVTPEAPVAPAAIPSNVRDYLVKRLGYSPEAVAGMTPEQAIAVGKAQTPPGDGQGAPPKPKVVPSPSDAAIAQQPSPLSTRDVPIRGKKPVGVRPADPGAADTSMVGGKSRVQVNPEAAAQAPETLAARTAAEPSTTRTTREKGINPRSIDKANTAGQKFVETGDPASLDAWAAGVAKEAEEAAASAVKAGYKASLDAGTRISSNPFADPDLWKKAARVLVKTPAGRFYLGAVGGALVGHEEDDPWSATAMDALTGGLVATFANRKTAKEALTGLQRLRMGENWFGERGVRPVLPQPGQKWGGAVDALSSPQRAIPELRDVQAKYEVAEQSLRGFDSEGKPLADYRGHLTEPELIAATRDALKDTRSATRKIGKQFAENAKKAYAEGNTELGQSEKAKARYVRAVLERLENQPTLSAQVFGGGPRAQKVDRALADVQYGLALLWNFGLGRVLNKTQKYYALNYVPLAAISKAKKTLKTDAGKAATDFLHVERVGLDSELTDPDFMASIGTSAKDRAKGIWQTVIEKSGGNALKASDEQNRRVTYLAATDYAKSKGGVQTARGFDKSPEAIHRWAMDVVNATQGVVGPMGQSPYISRIGKAATTFTKFSGLTMELALDMANNPRPETLVALGVLGSLMALNELAVPEDYQLDLWKMLGAKVPVGFTSEGIPKPPAVGQLSNLFDAVTNDNQSVSERALRAITPDSPERYYDEIFGEGGFLDAGMGTHRHPNRYGSLDEHSGTDALARMFGLETEKNSERIKTAQQQRNFAKRTTEVSASSNRPARQKTRVEKLKRSAPGQSSRDDTRSRVPVKARKDFDARWPKEQP